MVTVDAVKTYKILHKIHYKDKQILFGVKNAQSISVLTSWKGPNILRRDERMLL
jgi:hypothetical protein